MSEKDGAGSDEITNADNMNGYAGKEELAVSVCKKYCIISLMLTPYPCLINLALALHEAATATLC